MSEIWEYTQNLLSKGSDLYYWVIALSIFTFVASILALPFLVSLIPENYFLKERRRLSWTDLAPDNLIIFVIKNTVGIILLILGTIMLITPGQGLLTIIAGVILISFPGKYNLERWLIKKPKILNALNWLRSKRGCRPLKTPDD